MYFTNKLSWNKLLCKSKAFVSLTKGLYILHCIMARYSILYYVTSTLCDAAATEEIFVALQRARFSVILYCFYLLYSNFVTICWTHQIKIWITFFYLLNSFLQTFNVIDRQITIEPKIKLFSEIFQPIFTPSPSFFFLLVINFPYVPFIIYIV